MAKERGLFGRLSRITAMVFMTHFKGSKVGEKRPRGDLWNRTLTIGLAVKNLATAEFEPSDLETECAKFGGISERQDRATGAIVGKLTNVLVGCATRYCTTYQAGFQDKRYQTVPTSSRDINEVLLLGLSTPEKRTEFMGLSDDLELAPPLDRLIGQSETAGLNYTASFA